MDLTLFFKEKHIALVGPSQSIMQSLQGDLIEQHDYVVRLNHQWPFDAQLEPHLGRRMDILYHCCSADYSMLRFAVPDFQKTKLVLYETGIQSAILQLLCKQNHTPCVDITQNYHNLTEKLTSAPNTGLVAITHLLSYPIASLSLFGLSFYREPYYSGYLGVGADSKYWQKEHPPRQIRTHRLDVQFNYVVQHLLTDPRLKLDDAIQQKMLESTPSWAYD